MFLKVMVHLMSSPAKMVCSCQWTKTRMSLESSGGAMMGGESRRTSQRASVMSRRRPEKKCGISGVSIQTNSDDWAILDNGRLVRRVVRGKTKQRRNVIQSALH